MEKVNKNALQNSARRGMSLPLATLCLGTFIGFASFAMDLGRVQLAKTELRRAADAAARAGAQSIPVSAGQAAFDAQLWSKKNAVDNRLLVDSSVSVTVGKWDTATRTFRTTLGSGETPDAVRVVLTRPATGSESVPLIWARLLNFAGIKIEAECIAQYVPGVYVNQKVEGTANPFLAGMPTGSVASLNNPHNSPDYAGNENSSDLRVRKQSPQPVAMPVQPGDILEFDEPAVGDVRHDPNLPYFGPDGQLNSIGRNTNGSENGISDIRAPINSLVGLFLGPDRPNRTAAPRPDPTHSPDTQAGRDFDVIDPQMKEIFFIGDGVNSGGQKQKFIVPQGATRLYLATWDFYEWNNNAGSRTIKITRPGRVITVK